jgi:GntR family transcriptional repressor for pyruvate dehydrogenase complex
MASESSPRPKLKRSPSLTAQVIDYLTGEMQNGALKPGDRLPAESVLAGQLGVSRIVVREAFSGLRHDGMIDIRQGLGAFIAEPHQHRAFRIDRLETAGPDDIRQLFELRTILEGSAAGLAAMRRSETDVARLRHHVDAMARAVADGSDGVAPDIGFHQHLATASGNVYLSSLMQFLEGRLRILIDRARENTRRYPGLSRQVQDEHEDIFQAVENRNAEGARLAALHHLEEAARRLGMEGTAS